MKKFAFENQLRFENFWKCPGCNQVIEIQFDSCWNCQAEKPAKIEFPSPDEILQYQTEDHIEINTENYWKCPKCGQTVEMNFDTCWNCEQTIEAEIERPTMTEMINYQSDTKVSVFFKSGISIILAGIVLIVFSGLSPISEVLGFDGTHYGRLIFGIFFIIAGIVILILKYSNKSGE